ncbi:MAG: M48 family metalloprotease [Owenweeksia sp.]|nr:M48 family metalloprotease [Owenweeksia sp.]
MELAPKWVLCSHLAACTNPRPDELGLTFMAMAGYDPRRPLSSGKSALQHRGGQKPPEWLSTHPSDETRIKNLNKWMPEALKYYNPN